MTPMLKWMKGNNIVEMPRRAPKGLQMPAIKYNTVSVHWHYRSYTTVYTSTTTKRERIGPEPSADRHRWDIEFDKG